MSTENTSKSFSLHPSWGFFAIFAIGFPLFFLFRAPMPQVYATLPEIELTDHNNKRTSLEDFQQTISVVNFIFTRCQDVCPMLSAHMAQIHKKIPQARFFSISVDPEYDQPDILKIYAEQFTTSDNWRFLTGSRAQITHVNEAFQQAYEHQKSEGDAPNILHSQKFIIVDKKGRIRGFYDDNPSGIKRLLQEYHQLNRFF